MDIGFSKELIHKFVTRVCYDVFGLNKYPIVYNYEDSINTYTDIQICTYDENGDICEEEISYWNVFSPLINPMNVEDSPTIDAAIASINSMFQSEFPTLEYNNDMMNRLQELLSYDINEFKLLLKLI